MNTGYWSLLLCIICALLFGRLVGRRDEHIGTGADGGLSLAIIYALVFVPWGLASLLVGMMNSAQ